MKKSIRFEIFKRDNFTCQYCGRKTPEVILETDHIVPKVEGGTDDIQNLITSCFECNRGKGRTPLTKIKTRDDLKEETYLLAEKEMQLQEYYKLLEFSEKRIEKDLEEIGHHFFDSDKYIFGGQYKKSFKWFLKIFTKNQIKEAIDIAWRRFPAYVESYDNDRFKYVCGILHNWRKQK